MMVVDWLKLVAREISLYVNAFTESYFYEYVFIYIVTLHLCTSFQRLFIDSPVFLLGPSSCLFLANVQQPVQLYRYFDTSWVQT